MDPGRSPEYMSSNLPHFRAFHHHYHPNQGCPSCPHPVTRSCNNSITSTDLHLTLTINSATYFMGRSTRNACRTFRARIWCGSSTIWMRYVATSLLPAPRLSQRRPSIVSILRVPLPGSVNANSEPYAVLLAYSQRRICFRLNV